MSVGACWQALPFGVADDRAGDARRMSRRRRCAMLLPAQVAARTSYRRPYGVRRVEAESLCFTLGAISNGSAAAPGEAVWIGAVRPWRAHGERPACYLPVLKREFAAVANTKRDTTTLAAMARPARVERDLLALRVNTLSTELAGLAWEASGIAVFAGAAQSCRRNGFPCRL